MSTRPLGGWRVELASTQLLDYEDLREPVIQWQHQCRPSMHSHRRGYNLQRNRLKGDVLGASTNETDCFITVTPMCPRRLG